MYQASAGKNTIGTAKPGNNSGNSISRGSVDEMGIITQAKERMENIKLNIISPFFNHFINAQYSGAANKHINILTPIIFGVVSTLEKSASVAKK